MLLLLKHAAHFSGCTFAHTARQTDLVGDAYGFCHRLEQCVYGICNDHASGHVN